MERQNGPVITGPSTRWLAIAADLIEARHHGLLEKVELSYSGLRIDETLNWEEWVEFGKALASLTRSVHFWIGDWLNFGERKHGEKYSQAIELTGFSYDTLSRDKWVCSRFDFGMRRQNLTFSHHLEAARLPLASEREAWLEAAEVRGLSTREFRQVLKAAKQEAEPRKPVETSTWPGRLEKPSPGVACWYDDAGTWTVALVTGEPEGPGISVKFINEREYAATTMPLTTWRELVRHVAEGDAR